MAIVLLNAVLGGDSGKQGREGLALALKQTGCPPSARVRRDGNTLIIRCKLNFVPGDLVLIRKKETIVPGAIFV